jgi:2-isopropylmalate synthase
MATFNHNKYQPFAPVAMQQRRWPDQTIKQAPRWCSVDLRDGNQALIEPMSVAQKTRLFELLVKVGFKEIEVGFPAASQQDFDFVRQLIEEERIPDDVTIQVLTQAREPLIIRTFDSLKGAKRAIVHVYNSTSTVQREQVFKLDRKGIIDIAQRGARSVKACAEKQPQTEWVFQYSPESFTGTELDFSVDVCNAVTDIWQPTPDLPVILNLPSTVEMATPNVYADQIEYFSQHIAHRDAVIISLHTHNDRGCAVAAAELGVMAGAERVEGTLLGNGERTGNMDIVTMAMNLYSQGIDPELDLSDMDEIIRCVKACTQLPVHPRHPYAGELVFTAFSGSHQDAINKCLAGRTEGTPWQVAYLPIDPGDLGRSYQEVIRINSQSGKGGIAYVLEHDYGLQLPRWLQIEFSAVVQKWAETDGSEVSPEKIWELFQQTYVDKAQPYQLESYNLTRESDEKISAVIVEKGKAITIEAAGSGVMEVFIKALNKELDVSLDILEYSEHALGEGVEKQAVSYIQLKCNGERYSGVAMHRDIISATLNAVLVAINQQQQQLHPQSKVA